VVVAFEVRAICPSVHSPGVRADVHIGVNFTVLHDTARSPPMYSVIGDLCIRVGKKGTKFVNLDNVRC
jgi:hypothetical protein